MLWKMILGLAAVSILNSGCAQDENKVKETRDIQMFNTKNYPDRTSTIYGAWDLGSSYDAESSATLIKTLYVNETSVGMAVVCSFPGEGAVTVGVESEADVTESSIEIKSTVERTSYLTKNSDSRRVSMGCTARITPQSFNYRINGDSLAILLPNGTTSNLQRK